MTRTQEEKKKIVSRIKRIEGQMKTLEKMVDRDAPCVEVMRLINSASGALKGLLTKIVTDHLNGRRWTRGTPSSLTNLRTFLKL